ncbi:cytochrome P450 2C31-like isoform X1 [Ostrea edulis]|uniref:cytochrome P450 2C31-like isoform X1 n=1 Tax=Ostrea edulis TaxID=37623 RepID=UPI002094956C|nr:cytochrome P450 2C31-like isoform X1 [Ostrea edulis]
MLEVITVFIILILCLYHYWKSRPCASNFPGPAGIPLFGVFFNVDLNRLHLKLYEWTLIYGNIFQFSVFGKSYISLNSADVIRDVLGLEPNATITASREPSFFGEYCLENYSDIVFSPYDEEWARRRKIGHQLLHTYGVGMHFLEDEILQKLADMKQFIRENEGKDLDPHDMVEEFLFKNLSSLVAGTTDPQLQRLMKEVDENANEIASPMVDLIFRMFPFLRFLPLSVARKPSLVKFCMDEMLKIIKELTNEGNIERGIYYELKNAKERHGLHFTDNHIKAILVNIIGAGFLTSRGTLMSLILLLAKHPKIQTKIQSEIDDVIGEREAHIKDRNSCPLTEAVILETLRYISHAPLAIPHYTSEDCIISGRTVGKGTTIITNLWTNNHSDEWHDPFVFRPERFMDDSGLLLPATHPTRKRLLVFGFGKRACLGEVFAKNRTFLFLATMMQTCIIRKPLREELSDLDPRMMMPGVVLQPPPYKVQFKLRERVL